MEFLSVVSSGGRNSQPQNSEYSKIFDLIQLNGITKHLMLMIVLNLDVEVDCGALEIRLYDRQ